MKAVRVKPNEEAKIIDVEQDLSAYQREVGGYIECVYPFEDEVALICNEEGKINGSLPNRALYAEGEVYDIIFGTFLVVGLNEDDFRPLTQDEAERYYFRFLRPEMFIKSGGKIIAIQY